LLKIIVTDNIALYEYKNQEKNAQTKRFVPARSALRNKALDPTALLGASWCKHPEAPAMLAGQRRELVCELVCEKFPKYAKSTKNLQKAVALNYQ